MITLLILRLSIMGNKPLCGNIEGEQRPPLNAISPHYDLSEDAFKTVKQDYLKFPDKFPYVLSQMNEKHMQFVDEYFNGLINEQKVLGDEFYASHNVHHVTWKRADELFKTSNLKITDHIKGENSYRVLSVYKILDWIMRQPKLVNQIFIVDSLVKEGLILVYLPYYGSHNHPIEIVIDNYLPTFNNNYVASLPHHSTLGMLFLEKALAKLLGSYQSLHMKSCKQIFEIVVGIPIVLENLGINDDEVVILSKFYNPTYKISTIQQELEAKHSQYIKINVPIPTNISISIWQIPDTEKIDQFAKHGDIIMELIKKEKNSASFSRVGYASRLWDNKTILRSSSPQQENRKISGKQFLTLEQGDYYLHIFSQSDKLSVKANIIVYSEHEVNLLFRKESNELTEIKRAMVFNIVNQTFSNLMRPLEEFTECFNVRSKFIWDGYRGILWLHPSSKQPKSIVRIQILPEYRKRIKFEEAGEFEMQSELPFNGGRIVSFIKLSFEDIGRFYKISPLLSNPA